MDTVSDSGLAALRSRLTIPVLGPGQTQQHVAAMLGKRFSILTMWRRWVSLYEKTMAEYGTRHYCASIRWIDVRPDQEQLLAGKEDVVFAALEEQGRDAIEEDGADVILIGSTTMHQSVEHLRERSASRSSTLACWRSRWRSCSSSSASRTPRRPTAARDHPGREAAVAGGSARIASQAAKRPARPAATGPRAAEGRGCFRG